MEKLHPEREPSEQRVMTLVLASLPQLIAARKKIARRKVFEALEKAQWWEGTNPNPGRKYMVNRYAEMLPGQA